MSRHAAFGARGRRRVACTGAVAFAQPPRARSAGGSARCLLPMRGVGDAAGAAPGDDLEPASRLEPSASEGAGRGTGMPFNAADLRRLRAAADEHGLADPLPKREPFLLGG